VSCRAVARSRQPAPEAGAPFGLVSNPRINNRGEVAFDGRVGTGEAPPEGTWLAGPGATRLAAPGRKKVTRILR
jgi:hypothetical protein